MQVWESGFISIPYTFDVSDLRPKLAMLMSGEEPYQPESPAYSGGSAGSSGGGGNGSGGMPKEHEVLGEPLAKSAAAARPPGDSASRHSHVGEAEAVRNADGRAASDDEAAEAARDDALGESSARFAGGSGGALPAEEVFACVSEHARTATVPSERGWRQPLPGFDPTDQLTRTRAHVCPAVAPFAGGARQAPRGARHARLRGRLQPRLPVRSGAAAAPRVLR